MLMLLLAVIVGSGFYTAYYLKKVYREKELEIERLNEVVDRLEGESRVAQVLVTGREVDPETRELSTTIKFLELDREGNSLAPRTFTIKGDVIYFDALVIKFDNDYVERGEALRGKSIAMFRRIFGEFQPPEEGFPLDEAMEKGGVPNIYRVNKNPSELEKDLWGHFWRYAADPEEAAERGVRVIQGEAVYNRLLPDNIYTLTLDNDGGLNIMTETIPAILREDPKTHD